MQIVRQGGVSLPILPGDSVSPAIYTEEIPVDWLDQEIFGDPVVARMYRLEAPELHRAVREAVLATLPDHQNEIAKQSLR